MPALPLVAFTCRNAAFRFSRSHTSFISRRVLAGRFGRFPPCLPASPAGSDGKFSFFWTFCRLSLLRFMSYLPLLSFRPSPSPDTMPSADFCAAVRLPLGSLSRRGDTRQISRGKFNRLPRTVAGSTLGVLDGYGLRGKSAARPALAPCIRFLSIDSHVCSTLPSDPASRR